MKVKIIYLFAILISCKNYSNKKDLDSIIIHDSIKVKGKISKDSIYNGVIQFYNMNNNKLISEYTYENGKREGIGYEYYLNNQISVKSDFKDDKENGYAIYYNEQGEITSKNFYYYGIQVGEISEFEKDSIKKYTFYGFDGKMLFQVNYDELKNKRITEEITDYFFINNRKYSEFVDNTFDSIHLEYFIYTPSPPNYSFKYTLVRINKDYKVLSIIRVFDLNEPWTIFTLPNLDIDEIAAIKLEINDPITGKITMFKKLLD